MPPYYFTPTPHLKVCLTNMAPTWNSYFAALSIDYKYGDTDGYLTRTCGVHASSIRHISGVLMNAGFVGYLLMFTIENNHYNMITTI